MVNLNKTLKSLNNRANIYLKDGQAALEPIYEKYGRDYIGVENEALLTNMQQIKMYNMELLEILEMTEKLENPTRETFSKVAPAIVSLFNDIKSIECDAKIGNVPVLPTLEELNNLEQELKRFLADRKSMISGHDEKTLSKLEIFRNKRKKYDEDSYFTRAISKLRNLANKEKGSVNDAR